MEKIRLSKNEKKVLRLVASGSRCPATFPAHIYCDCVRSLECKGLVKGAYVEGGAVEAAWLTLDGDCYLIENPKLRNPIEWKWAVPWLLNAINLALLIYIIIAKLR